MSDPRRVVKLVKTTGTLRDLHRRLFGQMLQRIWVLPVPAG